MRVTIYQPQYFPRLHYFNRILNSDVYVVFDSAQYVKSLYHIENKGDKKKHKSFQSDTPIKTDQGRQFLTIPVKHHGKQLPIRQKEVDYGHDWVRSHLFAIKFAYSKAEFFEKFFPEIEELLSQKYANLSELNIQTTLWGLTRAMVIDIPISELSIDSVKRQLPKNNDVSLKKILTDKKTGVKRPEGEQRGTQWTTEICKSLGATEYYCGGTAEAGYMEFDYYKKHGITPVIQSWVCPEYPQQFEKRHGFIQNLSILDLLLNVSQESTLKKLFSKKPRD